MNIEIYINNKLCDIESSDIGIRLKRQFFNPSELRVKDAQKSYAISFPVTANNNAIFGYKNIEETDSKFVIYDNVKVYVDGEMIFDGKFRLSEITKNYYRGNLGIPPDKTPKDIFGDKYMNQTGSWNITIDDLSGISQQNNKPDSEVIFPFALYGLMPKIKNTQGLEYSDKDIYDASVRFTLEDFLPSVNVIQMLKKVFENSGFNLSGTAIEDDLLTKLYVSYKNPNDYTFNYGINLNRVIAHGEWDLFYRSNTDSGYELVYMDDTQESVASFNLLKSTNNITYIDEDDIGNLANGVINVPADGLYKLRFDVNLYTVNENGNDGTIKVRIGTLNDFNAEFKIIRNFDGDLRRVKTDNTFYRNNQNQEPSDLRLKYPLSDEVNFIDPSQNRDFVCGLSFGKFGNERYENPLSTSNCNPMAIVGGKSWNTSTGYRAYSAVKSSGYYKSDGITTDGDYKVDLNISSYTNRISNTIATGHVSQIVWLERGDTLSLLNTITKKFYFGGGGFDRYDYFINHRIEYDIRLEPFQPYKSWLKMNDKGASTGVMDWDEAPPIDYREMNIISALPSNIKVNDWIENFCKAFNLSLTNPRGNEFKLDLKKTRLAGATSSIIDLDNKANVNLRTNQPLGLPYRYNIGFTIDTDEEGYMKFDANDEPIIGTEETGGGVFYTGSYETSEIDQSSIFSYCWYKEIFNNINGGSFEVPVITDHEIWTNQPDYEEMLDKFYSDKAQRFWFKDSTMSVRLNDKVDVDIATVKNYMTVGNKRLTLDYKDQDGSIMRNYFFITTNEKNYTVIDCYLSPDEYNKLPYSLIKFNGDLYNAAEIDGYDPTGKKQGTIKLIKRLR